MTVERTIILAAHGAGDGSDANRIASALAAEIARARPECEVLAAFHLGNPGFAAALDAARASHVTVVPLMTSRGWFGAHKLPTLLAQSNRARTDGGLTITITPPVGEVRMLLRSARDAALRTLVSLRQDDHPVCVIVVGHGTSRSASSSATTIELSRDIARAAPEAFVRAAFLDDSPLLEEVAAEHRDRTRVILPWLLGGGPHVDRDLRERTLGGSRGVDNVRQTIFLPPIGAGGALVSATLALVDSYAPKRVLRIGTRGSALALRQADEARAALIAQGIPTSLVLIDTLGDRELDRHIESFATDGPFTDELEQALAGGEIDLAVHSLKDLPLGCSPDTWLAALLPRADASEALVSRDGATLRSLPHGARIGTCSRRRAAQLALIRPDLRAVPMRGTVNARIAAVAAGEYDGAILAVAGLERLGVAARISERLDLDEFLPEAGQGAIALTARIDDQPACIAAASIDHAPTRAAIELEREVARLVEGLSVAGKRVAAVHATVSGRVRLRVRVIELPDDAVGGVPTLREFTIETSTTAEARAAVERELRPIELHEEVAT